MGCDDSAINGKKIPFMVKRDQRTGDMVQQIPLTSRVDLRRIWEFCQLAKGQRQVMEFLFRGLPYGSFMGLSDHQ